MFKSVISAVVFFTSLSLYAQNVIQYGKYSVTKDEFVRAFNKNKTQATDKAKAVKEYVDLYTNFKLKVRAAEDLRIDTFYQQQMDFENFRKQIEGNYLNDETTVKKMQDEALLRSQTDLHLMLYSVNFTTEPPAVDTTKLLELLKSLKQEFNAKPNPYVQEGIRQQDMGFVTVFSLPYRYENMVYALNTGETSALFRNKKGWHFFRLVDKRKSMGKWRLAQILLCFPPNADAAEKGRIQSKADSIYTLLKSGNEFAALARSFSEDRLTSTSGGEMPEFGVGKYDPAFMQAVASLQKDGDVSLPFTTSHGYHIVKRIAYSAQPDSLTDELLIYEIKQKLMQDTRLKESRDAFAKEVMKKVGCKHVKGLNTEDLYRYADSALQHADVETYCDSTPLSKKVILQFAKGNMKGSDWLRYARDARLNAEQYREESYEQLWSNYPATASMEFYRAHLEDYNADFAFQLKEFKEGNMLFDIMEKQVWTKASNDSVGLRKYFDEHQSEYRWNESVDVLVFNCNSTNVAYEVQQKLTEGMEWRKVLEMKMDEVQGDSGRFELNQIGLTMVSGKMSGKFSDITVNQDGTATFMQYLDFHAKGEPRSFDQAKGIVINEYQTVLEKKWLDDLRKKYPVKVNNAVVESVIKQL